MFTDKVELKDFEKQDPEYQDLLRRVLAIQADCEIGPLVRSQLDQVRACGASPVVAHGQSQCAPAQPPRLVERVTRPGRDDYRVTGVAVVRDQPLYEFAGQRSGARVLPARSHEQLLGRERNGAGATGIAPLLHHFCIVRGVRSAVSFRFLPRQFETDVQVPICNRLAIHFRVIVVSWRNRQAIFTFSGSPFLRKFNSRSPHPRRRNSATTTFSACASSASRSSAP